MVLPLMVYTPSAPDRCRNGHVYQPYRVLVGFRHCSCSGASVGGGHRTYACRVEGCADRIVWGCVDETKLSDYRPR